MTAPWGGCCLPTSPSLQLPKASDPKLGESSVPSPSWVNRPAPAGGEGQGWGGVVDGVQRGPRASRTLNPVLQVCRGLSICGKPSFMGLA